MRTARFLVLCALLSPSIAAAQPGVGVATSPPTPTAAQTAAAAPPVDPAFFREGPSIDELRALIRYEPSVSQTMRAALRYFRVDPDNFDSLRTSARLRALMPTLAGGLRVDNTDSSSFERQTITSPRENDLNTDARVTTLTLGGVWDFRELVFNPAEVQVYGVVGVQRDVMLETTRVYFLRRQLVIRFASAPPADPVAREALLLRIDEFTAVLDVLTGGWFSEQTAARARRARARGEQVPEVVIERAEDDAEEE